MQKYPPRNWYIGKSSKTRQKQSGSLMFVADEVSHLQKISVGWLFSRN